MDWCTRVYKEIRTIKDNDIRSGRFRVRVPSRRCLVGKALKQCSGRSLSVGKWQSNEWLWMNSAERYNTVVTEWLEEEMYLYSGVKYKKNWFEVTCVELIWCVFDCGCVGESIKLCNFDQLFELPHTIKQLWNPKVDQRLQFIRLVGEREYFRSPMLCWVVCVLAAIEECKCIQCLAYTAIWGKHNTPGNWFLVDPNTISGLPDTIMSVFGWERRGATVGVSSNRL